MVLISAAFSLLFPMLDIVDLFCGACPRSLNWINIYIFIYITFQLFYSFENYVIYEQVMHHSMCKRSVWELISCSPLYSNEDTSHMPMEII